MPAAKARVPASRVLAVGVGSSAASAQPAGSLDTAAVEKAAEEAVQKAVEAIRSGRFDLIVLNFANPDMVGHTGDLAATIEAVEHCDKELVKPPRLDMKPPRLHPPASGL